jgi:hypothetical protein
VELGSLRHAVSQQFTTREGQRGIEFGNPETHQTLSMYRAKQRMAIEERGGIASATGNVPMGMLQSPAGASLMNHSRPTDTTPSGIRLLQ